MQSESCGSRNHMVGRCWSERRCRKMSQRHRGRNLSSWFSSSLAAWTSSFPTIRSFTPWHPARASPPLSSSTLDLSLERSLFFVALRPSVVVPSLVVCLGLMGALWGLPCPRDAYPTHKDCAVPWGPICSASQLCHLAPSCCQWPYGLNCGERLAVDMCTLV